MNSASWFGLLWHPGEREMSKSFESIKKGLEEALEHSQGKGTKAIVHHLEPVDVKKIRRNTGMSQTEFAAALGISVATLRHWERGDRVPRGPALTLLNLVAREPKFVLRALAG